MRDETTGTMDPPLPDACATERYHHQFQGHRLHQASERRPPGGKRRSDPISSLFFCRECTLLGAPSLPRIAPGFGSLPLIIGDREGGRRAPARFPAMSLAFTAII